MARTRPAWLMGKSNFGAAVPTDCVILAVMSVRWLTLLALSLASFLGGFAVAAPVRDKYVEAELVASTRTAAPGERIFVALRLTHDPGWHTYWINPGTGITTELVWELPPGWEAGPLQWPPPKLLKDAAGDVTGNGYEGTVLLPVEVVVPAQAEVGSRVRLKAVASWLMCEVSCVPGEAALELELAIVPAGSPPVADERWAAEIAATRARFAQPPVSHELKAVRTGEFITLSATALSGANPDPGNLHFFSEDSQVDYAAPQAATRTANGWQVALKVNDAGPKADRLVGEWVASRGWQVDGSQESMRVTVPYTREEAGVSPAPSGPNLGMALLLAFAGGLILNLMPCVFPVLGVKILGFVQQAGSDRRQVVLHGLVFSAGVVLSLWVVAGVLLLIRAGGVELGWGYQLQDPRFIYAITILLLLVALNLSGLFEVGLSATGVGAELTHRGGLVGTFFSGVLATVVATPCSAPLLAPAVGAALAMSSGAAMLTFTALGFGLAAPYLALSLFPGAVRVLPRPGAWMETFKQAMAFLMYGTVAYLIWVLDGQVSSDALLRALIGLVAVSFAAWVYGRFLGYSGATGGKRIACWLLVLVSAAAALTAGWPKSDDNTVVWKEWSREAVAAQVAEGRILYVDFTARWCATCQTNKAAVFSSQEVLDFIRDEKVVLLRADWTQRGEAIAEELARFGRASIPFNLVYLPGRAEPIVLPEVLTPGIVLDALRSNSGS